MKITSQFIIPALVVTSAIGFARFQYESSKVQVDYSAFKNFIINVNEISNSAIGSAVASDEIEDTRITREIIQTIDKEISKNIVQVKHSSKIKKSKIKINIPALHLAENGSEINNKDIINVENVEKEKKSFAKFDQTIVDVVSVNDSATTEVKTQASGPIEPEVADAAGADSEMKIFEYSTPVDPTVTGKKEERLYDRALSPTVKEVISREVGNNLTKITPSKILKESKNDLNNEEEQIIFDYTKPEKVKKPAKKDHGFTSAITNNNYLIKAINLKIETSTSEEIGSFDFVPDYNKEERVDSDANGIASMRYDLNGGLNTQTGIIEANGMMNTRVELNLNTQNQLSVPMISLDEAEKLYSGRNLVLIGLSPVVADVEIDGNYSEKIYLDQNMKRAINPQEAKYAIFVGTRSGNVLLKYYLNNKETAQKIIYIGERELYFENAEFINGEREIFSFNTRNQMSSKVTDLTIAPELITVFNTGIISKKRTLSSYELKMPTMVLGTRKYLEMKHLDASIFVGADEKLEIDIPNNAFISNVLRANKVNELKDRCIVQINLNKELSSFTVNGKNQTGEMYTEYSFLDEDGNFSATDYESAEKVFVLGDMEGVFGAKLEYSDGSSQFLKTYCSQGTYVVEQL